MPEAAIDRLLAAVAAGTVQPLYLVAGDLVLGEPQAVRLAEALAARAGCAVETRRRPASLGPILEDLRTYSLFASAKVVLATDTAVLADRNAAADLIDQAAEGVPLPSGEAELAPAQREAASRLLQALRLFRSDPHQGSAEAALDALPAWAFQGGAARRKGGRGRSAKQAAALKADLVPLLEAARGAGLEGYAEGDLAELGAVVERGLPAGHALVLAERSVADGHPLVATLERAGALVRLGQVEAGRGGGWEGVAPLAAELARQTGVRMAPDAVAELGRRTLRQAGGFKTKGADADSTARFAAEYRKLASLVPGGEVSRTMVEESVADRGEEDVWQILDALGAGRAGEALARYRRFVAGADDPFAARLSFFSLLAGFCRQLVAVAGMIDVAGVPRGVANYQQFKNRWAPALQGPPASGKNPLAGLHPYRLHRAYLAASRRPPEELARLPWEVLETEQRLKGESTDADAAVTALMVRLAGGAGVG